MTDKQKANRSNPIFDETAPPVQNSQKVQLASSEIHSLKQTSEELTSNPSHNEEWKKSREAFLDTFCGGPENYSDIQNMRPKDTRITLFISAEHRDRLAAIAWYRERHHPERYPVDGRYKPSINSLFDEAIKELTSTEEANLAFEEYKSSEKYREEMLRIRLRKFLAYSDEDTRLWWFFLNNYNPKTEHAEIVPRDKHQGEESGYYKLLNVWRDTLDIKGHRVGSIHIGQYVLAGDNRVYDLANKKYMRLIK